LASWLFRVVPTLFYVIDKAAHNSEAINIAIAIKTYEQRVRGTMHYAKCAQLYIDMFYAIKGKSIFSCIKKILATQASAAAQAAAAAQEVYILLYLYYIWFL
jgi:hypothetical protein